MEDIDIRYYIGVEEYYNEWYSLRLCYMVCGNTFFYVNVGKGAFFPYIKVCVIVALHSNIRGKKTS